MMEHTNCDVAIVGLGPGGATLANLLGQAGVSVSVIEKEASIYPLPRAIHFDGEVMRIFQSIGLREQVEEISRPGLKGMHFVNAHNETLLIRGGTGLNGPHGCANNYYFHQPELEEVLREGLNRFPNVSLYLEHEVVTVDPIDEDVTLRVNDKSSNTQKEITAKYVIGCDGARSFLRRAINSGHIDLGLEQPWLVFDILLNENAPSLPDHTVQICDPARPMTFCNVTKNRRRFEIMLIPGDDSQKMTQENELWKLVSKWIKPEQASIERAAIYTFHSIIASGWRKNRIILAGDACHQTPPFLGQGMCACLRDVANLAWKLIAVIQRNANDVLLDTYEEERSPHVKAFIELAVKIGDLIQTTDPELAKERDEQLLSDKPTIFQFPTPQLGPGFWRGTHPSLGTIFPQPQIQSHQRMDEEIGSNFAILTKNQETANQLNLSSLQQSFSNSWRDTQFAILLTENTQANDWLIEQDVNYALIRPDRYIAALSMNAENFSNDLLNLFSN